MCQYRVLHSRNTTVYNPAEIWWNTFSDSNHYMVSELCKDSRLLLWFDPMAAASSSSFSSTIPTSQAVNIHHLISVKLDHHYYLLWRTQFMPLLKPYDLEGYVDGSLLCPPHTLPSDKGDHDSLTLIPACIHWTKQDQVLLGWLLSSLSETTLAHVVGLSTARAIWLL